MKKNDVDGQMTLFDLDTQYGRTCPECSAVDPPKARTSASSSKNLSELRTTDYMCLDLQTEFGSLLGPYWEYNSAWLGEFWTLNTGPAPHNAVAVSTLSQILQGSVLPKYYLSPTACKGILRRAKARGKTLPRELERALIRQSTPGIRRVAQLWISADETMEIVLDNSLGEAIFGDLSTPWDVQSKRIHNANGTWPSLYSSDGGGRGCVAAERNFKSYAANQRDEVRDLHDIAGALQASPGMKQQTFVAQPQANSDIFAFHINQREETIDLGGVSGALLATRNMQMQTFVAQQSLTSWDVQSNRIFTPEGVAPALSGADGGGGRNPGGLVMTAGFCAGAAPTAGGIGYQEECAPTLKAAESGTNQVGNFVSYGSRRPANGLDARNHRHAPCEHGKPSTACACDAAGRRGDWCRCVPDYYIGSRDFRK